MYGQDAFDVRTLLGFPARVLVTYFAFSLLFPFLYNISLFSFHFMVYFSCKLPFSVLRSLVSSSCSYFFFCSSMVDYSSVRVDWPSIAFLFAPLGCLLEAIEGECLKWVRLFVREDCPHNFVLSSLFPLVSYFARVARSLKMSKVRSSELETGSSSSNDRVIFKVTFLSTPYKAWNILCFLNEKDEKQIWDRFQFACHSYADEVCFYEADFTSGLHFPTHLFVRELFSYFHLAPSQLVPNSWQIVISYMVVWMSANDGEVIKKDEFLHFYHLRKSKDPSYYEFKLWDRASRLILDYPSSLRNWKPNFNFVFESGWEFVPGEDLDEAPKFFRSLGNPRVWCVFLVFLLFFVLLWVMVVCDILVFLFVVSQRPHLKKRYQRRVGKVKEYLETVKDFDELVVSS